MQGHDPRQGDGQKDTKNNRSGNQGGQYGERSHHSPSLTHDCVAARRGQVHAGFLNCGQSLERSQRHALVSAPGPSVTGQSRD